MQKAKKYDWKDSNMALFGSDTERKVKKESAMTEPAWEGAGQEVGIQIWRIVKFQVTSWPKEEYGSFYGNDSYIILNTYKKNDSENLLYDLHFWIGATSTQDEYGTAAYKTVELDTFLDDLAVQHREVQDHESSLFKSYFKTITIMKGGAETGFRHVEPKEYVPRLLQFNKQDKNTTVVEVPFTQKSLDSTDVFVLDAGTEIFQWHGTDSNAFERIKAGTYVQGLESDRGGINTVVLEEGQGGRFYELLPDEDIDPEQARDTVDASDVGEMKLLKVSDAEGSIAMSEVKSGTVSKEDLGSDDVYLVDTGLHVFVYVGSNASTEEKRNGLPYAQKYIMDGGNKPWVPVTVVREGQTSELDNQLA